MRRPLRPRAFASLLRPLASDRGAPDKLTAILDAAIEATQAERGFVLRVPSDTPELEILAARGFAQEPLHARPESVSRTAVTRVVERGRGLVTTNVEDRHVTTATSVVDRRVLSILCVPLTSTGDAHRLLYLDHRFVKQAFFSLDLPALERFGREVGELVRQAESGEPASPSDTAARLELATQLLCAIGARRTAAADPGGRAVFLVGDQPYAVEGLARVLESEPGLAVCGAVDDAGHALHAAEASQPDLILVDLLARGTALQLVKDLRRRLPRTPVLVIAAGRDHLHVERYLRTGVRGCLTRQAPISEVVCAIQKILAGSEVQVAPEFAARILGRLTPAGEGGSPIESLTDRELQVFDLVGRGIGTRRIAEQLHLSVKTVESHRARIKAKLGIDSGTELARCAFEWAHDAGAGGR